MHAFDRSMRRRDLDGHLHVEMTNISKANVCGYLGREIPNSEALGLDPNRVYKMYRDPAELAAGAKSFENKPLLMDHVPVTADAPAQDLWVGTVGAPVSFKAPYLQAPISVWTEEGIRLIESGDQQELSPSYRYRADMTPGITADGFAYDGVMRDIVGNHVALVSTGRTGPDVFVADNLPPELHQMKRPRFMALLATFFPAGHVKPEDVVALDRAFDEDDDSDLSAAMDAMTDEDKKTACDAFAKSKGKAMDAMSDEEKKEAYKQAAKDKRAKDRLNSGNASAPNAPEGGAPKPAQDAAIKLAVDAALAQAGEATKDYVSPAALKLAVDKATADAVTANNELHAARAAVAPTLGNEVALDSAEAVYRFALDKLKVDHAGVDASALKALYDVAVKATVAPQVAADAAPIDIYSLFSVPNPRR